MGVDLSLWVLNKSEKSFIVFSVQRRRSVWNELENLPSEAVPVDFHEYEGYTYYDRNNLIKKGSGRYSGAKEPEIRKEKDKNTNFIRSEKSKEQLMSDAYDNPLRSIKAIYLKILILEDTLLFEDAAGYYEKDIFLALPDDADVVLYWH